MTKTEQDENVPKLARYKRLGLVKEVIPVERAAGDHAIVVKYPDDRRTWLYTREQVDALLAKLLQRGGSVN
jgi:hypothetical protein